MSAVAFGPKERGVFVGGRMIGVARWEPAEGRWRFVDPGETRYRALEGELYDSCAELGMAVAAAVRAAR